MNNPYKNRNLPVGPLFYKPKFSSNRLDKASKIAMLEYGEPELMFDLPYLVGDGKFLNLGDSNGGSAILLALGIEAANIDGHVWTVDSQEDKHQQKARQNYCKCAVESKITQCHGTTKDFGQIFTNDNWRFNFCFIDADHSYEGVLRDWNVFSKLIVPGGLVAFHDTNQEYTDKVIRETVDWKQILWINRIKVFENDKNS